MQPTQATGSPTFLASPTVGARSPGNKAPSPHDVARNSTRMSDSTRAEPAFDFVGDLLKGGGL